MIRPWISRSPSTSARSTSSRAPGGFTPAPWSAPAEAVGAGAQVSGGVERVAAELARRPARGDHGLRALGERPGGGGSQADDQHLLRLGLLVLDQVLDDRLGLLDRED